MSRTSEESKRHRKLRPHHAFSIIEFDDGSYVCVEKFADKLEIMFGTLPDLCLYSCLFRANGEPRPNTLDGRPVVLRRRLDLEGQTRTIADILIWLDTQISKKYC